MPINEKRMRASNERRERIFSAAHKIIAEHGYDRLTTRGLAEAAGVTAPTLYNLVGSKEEIVTQMAANGVEDVWRRLSLEPSSSPLKLCDAIIDQAHLVFAEDPDFQRAIIIALDRLGVSYSAHTGGRDMGTLAADRCAEIAEQACEMALNHGKLRGNLSPHQLGLQMFIAFRGPLRDWAYGIIDAHDMMRRQKTGFYLAFAADAHDPYRQELLDAAASLAKNKPQLKAA
ncbi:MAG: TetR/AcrR family transcriptional regulator [Erythrobacter sp.]